MSAAPLPEWDPQRSIQDRLATGKGKFTPLYPHLGTGPVDYEDSISPEFFEAEREAVFKSSWLYVGRVERLSRPGAYFTRELPGGLASIVVARGLDGTVHAFHNVCAHRGNKVVWQEHPQLETQGSCRESPASTTVGVTGSRGAYLDKLDINDLPEDALRLTRLLYSMILASYAVNVFKQPHIPDSGAAWVETVVEPAI